MTPAWPRTQWLAALVCAALSLARPASAQQTHEATIPAPEAAQDPTSSVSDVEARDPTVPASQLEAPDPTVPAPVSQPHTVVAAPQPPAPTHAPQPSRAVDDEGARPLPRERTSRLRWYGYQTLLADALSIGLIVISREPLLMVAGVGSALLAAPIIHFVHGNAWGFASLGLRALSVGLLLAVFVPAAASEDGEGYGCVKACLEVALGAYVAAVFLDGLAFSLRREPMVASDRAVLAPLVAPGVLGAAAHLTF